MANKTVTVKSSGGDYASLNAALVGESADLVANTCVLTIECYNFQDTTQAGTGTGYTTSSSYYIIITVAAGNRHNGKWSTSGYRLVVNGSWGAALNIQETYTRVGWVQAQNTGTDTSGWGIWNYGVDNSYLYNCIVKGCLSAGYAISGFLCNCLSYDNGVYGYYANSWQVMNLYNCTAVDNVSGFDSAADNGHIVAVNCLGYSNSSFDFHSNHSTTCDHCASSDGTADDFGGTGNVVSIGDPFADFAGDDFHLSSSNSCIDAGTADPGSGLFSDDIDGVTRSGTWDIGADEYVGDVTTTTTTTTTSTTTTTTTTTTSTTTTTTTETTTTTTTSETTTTTTTSTTTTSSTTTTTTTESTTTTTTTASTTTTTTTTSTTTTTTTDSTTTTTTETTTTTTTTAGPGSFTVYVWERAA